ncbi:MAG: hypothetical protein HYW08_12505, partial [candidate division NC10 bacterium]|nr:hypothetical protein [candidate division NC10 bacterium]
RAYEFIRQGQNPNEPIAVRHPALTGGRPLLVSPLLWAVATNSRQSVLTLLGHGVTMGRPANSRAACLADALGNTELAALLRRLAEGIEVAPCRERKTGDAPLVSFVVPAQ